ncbi:UNVERIFIED_CONTAM: glycosyltransferase [Microbacterium sp. SLM126]
MTRRSAEAMVVVVPVRNEAELLRRSLLALTIAVESARDVQLRCEVRIVLDACTDASGAIAAGFDFPILECDAVRVGAARRFGVAAGLQAIEDVAADRVWLASTDADSQVPPHWLVHQRAISRAADVYLGTVRPDFGDLAPMQRDRWWQTHPRGRANRNVHGANLGVRAQTYLDAGGFASIGEHEDVDLVARCRALGAVVLGDDDAEVLTSGRFVGRTPGGYAEFLRRQSADLVGDSPAEAF